MKERRCQVCKSPLRGRADQRFCDGYCRGVFHNRRRRDEGEFIRLTIRQLRINRRILKLVLETGRDSARLSELVPYGFRIDLFTGQNPDGTTRCFDFQYQIDEEEIRAISINSTVDTDRGQYKSLQPVIKVFSG